MTPAHKAQLQIHACVVLWGFTAVLGKLITLATVPLVFWRMLLVACALLAIPAFWRGLHGLGPRGIAVCAGIGVIIALQWLTFYGAIKLANASIAATCIALCSVFVALIEPVLLRRRFDRREIVFGLAVVPGVALVVGATPTSMRWGLGLGVLSALLGALFTAFNKRIANAGALSVTGVEMGAGALLLACVGPWLPSQHSPFAAPDARDAVLLLVLAFACTLLPFALWLVALRHLSAFTSMLAINLEPVYAIVLAIALLGEQRELDAQFYAGVAIIIGIVLAYPSTMRSAALRGS